LAIFHGVEYCCCCPTSNIDTTLDVNLVKVVAATSKAQHNTPEVFIVRKIPNTQKEMKVFAVNNSIAVSLIEFAKKWNIKFLHAEQQ